MLKTMTTTLAMMFCAFSALNAANRNTMEIYLDNAKTKVRFVDGDTIKVLEGEFERTYARIMAINSLETYGPVHSFAHTDADYLLTIAHEATSFATASTWHCHSEKRRDVYNRLLIKCDDLAKAMLTQGLAHAYSISDKPAPAEYLAAQKKAQTAHRGMWKYDVPDYIVTSLHSKEESARQNYNRLISTKDGTTLKMFHKENYKICQNVCTDDNTSCMTHVPFGKRYNQKPYCLKK